MSRTAATTAATITAFVLIGGTAAEASAAAVPQRSCAGVVAAAARADHRVHTTTTWACVNPVTHKAAAPVSVKVASTVQRKHTYLFGAITRWDNLPTVHGVSPAVLRRSAGRSVDASAAAKPGTYRVHVVLNIVDPNGQRAARPLTSRQITVKG